MQREHTETGSAEFPPCSYYDSAVVTRINTPWIVAILWWVSRVLKKVIWGNFYQYSVCLYGVMDFQVIILPFFKYFSRWGTKGPGRLRSCPRTQSQAAPNPESQIQNPTLHSTPSHSNSFLELLIREAAVTKPPSPTYMLGSIFNKALSHWSPVFKLWTLY